MIKVHLIATPPVSLVRPLPKSLPTLRICKASSLVGQRISARGPLVTAGLCVRRWRRGIRYASVFPDPVRAIPRTSRGGIDSVEGSVARCIGVGDLKPRRNRARAIAAETPVNQNDMRDESSAITDRVWPKNRLTAFASQSAHLSPSYLGLV
jgi:hypothetical protein